MSFKNVRESIAAARLAQFGTSHVPRGLDMPTWEVRKAAAVGGALNLTSDNVSNLFDKNGVISRAPPAVIAANTVKLSAAILKNSRVADVGANIIICPDNRRAVPTGRTGDVVFERVPTSFRTHKAAKFSVVADDADVPTSAHPFLSGEIEWDLAQHRGLRMEFTRAEQKQITDPDLLAAEIEAAIALGIARAADEALLSHLATLTPGAFTLAKAAADGLKFGELAALVGTAANGATIGADGELRAAGIAAEFTPDMAGTLIAAWDRTAVVIRSDVALHYERLDLHGNLAVTAWINVIALAPDASCIWSVPA